MSNCGSSPIWCLCEKLPRSILHIAPTPDHWCEVCGGRRRPRACFSSSSDEDERAAERRQSMLVTRRRRQEKEAARQGLVRVKVAMTAMKPKSRRKSNCFKCGGQQRQSTSLAFLQQHTRPNNSNSNNHNHSNNNRLYMGRLGHFRKPQRIPKRREEDCKVGSKQQLKDLEPMPSAPPPPPTPPASSSPPASNPACGESFWDSGGQDVPNLVAFAHDVCNRPLHLRQRQPNYYDNLFVSDFIPLDKPITDPSGGAISKHRGLFGRPMRSHYSRALPPLSQVLSDILAKQKVRAKGGGLSQRLEESRDSQFSPFNSYDGPSEDALVVEAARRVLRQPKALHIKQRTDLLTTRLSSFDSEPSSDCSSSTPFDMPTAPPAERPRVAGGAPFRLHEMMKAVAQSGLSDSSASSSSTASSSHKSVSSTLPVLQQSVRSRGGEEPSYEEKPMENGLEADIEPISIMEKLLWFIDQKPTVEVDPIDGDKLESHSIQDNHKESVKVLLQLMESLQIEGGVEGENHSTLLENDLENDLHTTVDSPLTEVQHSNDMSNVLPLNSTNKSAGDAKYLDGFLNAQEDEGQRSETGGSKTSSSMFSFISGFFLSIRSKGSSSDSSNKAEETKPLKASQNKQYGSINGHQTRENSHSCRGKKSISTNTTNCHCKKCGLNRLVTPKSKKNCPFHEGLLTRSSSYHTAKTTQRISEKKEESPIKSIDSQNVKDAKVTKKDFKAEKNISKLKDTKTILKRKALEPFKKSPDPQQTKKPKKFQEKAIETSTKYQNILNLKKPNELQRKSMETPNLSQNMIHLKESKELQRKSIETLVTSQNMLNLKETGALQRNSLKTPNLTQNMSNLKEANEIGRKLIEMENIPNFKTIERKANTVIKESAASSAELESETQSTDELSAFPIQRDIQLTEVMENLRRRQPKSPTVLHMIKTVETVRYECSEIIQPKMVSSVRELGRLRKYTLKPMSLSKPFGLLEFRTPDVREIKSNEIQTSEFEKTELSEESVNLERKQSNLKIHQLAGWPAHPFRHRKRQLKYKSVQMELSYTVNDKSLDNGYDALRKHKNSAKNDQWLANKLVQKKIHEMMTKPIKLLSFNEGTAIET